MSGKTFVVVGCLNREAPYFKGAHGKGLAVFEFAPESGRLTLVSEKPGIDNPTYLTVHEGNGCIYASSEVFGWNEGVVSAYRLHPETGALTYINKQPALGSITAHHSFDKTGRFLLVANYSIYAEPADSGPDQAVAVLPIRSDGGLGAPASSHAHPGGGPNALRQERSHAHCIFVSPDNRHALVADLGTDEVVVYRFNAENGALTPSGPKPFKMSGGAGPRHFVFHPSGRWIYLINELDSTVAALAFDAASGGLNLLHTVAALPAGYREESHCSGIQITPDGRFLYGANRGHDSIAAYAIDPSTGKLSLIGHQSTLGRTPRDFTVDPSGRFLIVANQDSDLLTLFRIDRDTGKLIEAGRAEIGTPMCAKFAQF